MAAVIVTRVIKNVGLNMLIFMAALRAIPDSLLEAAEVDGANAWRRIRHIILPLMTPTVLVVLIITTAGAFQVFDHITLMTGGGPANSTNVLVTYIVFQAFRAFDTGYASALAVVLFVLTLGLTIIQWGVRRRLSYTEV